MAGQYIDKRKYSYRETFFVLLWTVILGITEKQSCVFNNNNYTDLQKLNILLFYSILRLLVFVISKTYLYSNFQIKLITFILNILAMNSKITLQYLNDFYMNEWLKSSAIFWTMKIYPPISFRKQLHIC